MKAQDTICMKAQGAGGTVDTATHDRSSCPGPEQIIRLAWHSHAGGSPAQQAEHLFAHVLECAACLREYRASLCDQALARNLPTEGRPATLQVRAGHARVPTQFAFRRATVFRSGGLPVLHSAIHPLERDYVLLELSGYAGDLRLLVERGRKNGPPIPISLYMNEELSDQRRLQTQHMYRLADLVTGSYQLRLAEQPVFQFNVRE